MLECGLSLKPITPNWLKKFKMMRKIMGRDNTHPPREFFAGHVKLPQYFFFFFFFFHEAGDRLPDTTSAWLHIPGISHSSTFALVFYADFKGGRCHILLFTHALRMGSIYTSQHYVLKSHSANKKNK